MQTLTNDLILVSIVLMLTGFALLFINIHIMSHYQKNAFIFLVHGSSLLTLLFITFLWFNHSIFNLSLPRSYVIALAIASAIGWCLVLFFKNKSPSAVFVHNLQDVFYSLTDLIVVFDAYGQKHISNHPKLESIYFGHPIDALSDFDWNPSPNQTQEIHLNAQTKLWVHSKPIYRFGYLIGSICIFYDASDTYALLRSIEDENRALEKNNAAWIDYMNDVKDYEHERLKFDVLKMVQNDFLSRLEAVSQALNGNPNTETLKQLADQLRSLYSDLRKSIQSFKKKNC